MNKRRSPEEDVAEENDDGNEGNSDKNSDYERVRLENIRRNQSFLANIGLDEVQQSLRSDSKRHLATKRGATAKKVSLRNIQPTRRSSRVTIDRLKEQIADAQQTGATADLEEKEALLAKMLSDRENFPEDQAQTMSSNSPEYEVVGPEPINMLTPTNEPDEAVENWGSPLLVQLREANKRSKSAVVSDVSSELLGLTLAEDDVAKLTLSRITSVWLHPTPHKLICAAGDKIGCLGLWDVDSRDTGNGGVFRYRPHNENIMFLHSSLTEPSKLYSASYDNTLRFIELNKDSLVLGFSAPEDTSRFCSTNVLHDDGRQIVVGTMDGMIHMADLRAKIDRFAWSYSCHDGKINSIQMHPTNSNLCISASGGSASSIRVHDIRQLPKAGQMWKPISVLSQHSKSISSAAVSPDGKFMVSVSMDNSIRTWIGFDCDVGKSNSADVKSCRTNHNNHTGRWLSTFQVSFDPKQQHTFVLGSMDSPRRLELFSPNKESTGEVSLSLLGTLSGLARRKRAVGSNVTVGESELMQLGSVCSRNCFHSFHSVIAAGNSSGRVHIFR